MDISFKCISDMQAAAILLTLFLVKFDIFHEVKNNTIFFTPHNIPFFFVSNLNFLVSTNINLIIVPPHSGSVFRGGHYTLKSLSLLLNWPFFSLPEREAVGTPSEELEVNKCDFFNQRQRGMPPTSGRSSCSRR